MFFKFFGAVLDTLLGFAAAATCPTLAGGARTDMLPYLAFLEAVLDTPPGYHQPATRTDTTYYTNSFHQYISRQPAEENDGYLFWFLLLRG